MKQNERSLKSRLLLMLALMLLVPLGAFAQNITVKGIVMDATGETVIGASVVEEGNTGNGTITGLDGDFTLSVPQGKNIVVSYVGMVSQTVKAVAGQTLRITLKDDSQMVEEVVVIGYGGSKARKDLTGSVGSISGAKLAAVPVTSAAVALQGKIAGVQVTTVDGAPGADINIRVRGGTSVTQSNEPLYIVDGFQVDNINDIPPTDIASIDVLKDASITAIYGAKGGNGVVVVTTKAAKAGKVTVSVNAQMSTSQLSKKLDLMNAYNFVDYQYEWHAWDGMRSDNAKFFRANFGNPNDIDMYSTLPTHDWQDEVMGENPFNYSTNVTVGGGSESMRFNLSVTQSEDKGIIMGSGVRRTNVNLKTSIDLAKNLTLNFNPKFSFRRDEGAGGDNIGTGGIIDVLRYRPTNGLREFGYIDPSYADPDEEELFTYTNPKSDIQLNQQRKYSHNYTNALSLEWKPIEGLVLRTEATIGLNWNKQKRFWGALTGEGQKHNTQPVAQIEKKERLKYIWTNTAAYAFTWKDAHNFNFLLGQEIQHDQTEKSFQKNRYFPRDFSAQSAWNNMGFGTPYESYTELSTAVRMASFFGQIGYNYDHKYLFSFTMRADGSTKFAPGEQWGYFPSVAGAWTISEEPFMQDVEWIDMLKLRAAIGLAGNNNIDNDMWRHLYAINSTGGPGFGEATQFGEQFYGNNGGDKFANEKIKWETTLTRNVAADITLFGGRLTVTPEFYWNTTKDLLYKSDIPSATGYTSQMQNIGQVTNKGIELSISGDILQGRDYVLSANFSMGMNKRKIDKLTATDDGLPIWFQNSRWKSSLNDYCMKVGDEVGLIYGFVYDGLYGFDEFYFDPANNLQPLPWGSSQNENGHKDFGTTDPDTGEEHPKTVINTVSNDAETATQPGKIKFKDLNGDGKIDEKDRTVIGNTNPKLQGGFGLSGQWKNFDFAANFQYMLDFDVNNATAYQLSSSESNNRKFFNILDDFSGDNRFRYTREDGETLRKNTHMDNTVQEWEAMNANATLWNPLDVTKKITHSYFIEDGSFLRCQDITLGYTLPKELTRKVGMSKVRFYASCSNVFIITGYSGYDPEVDVQTGLTCGMDYNRYPRSRSFIFGTNITF